VAALAAVVLGVDVALATAATVVEAVTCLPE
jgi:hypothetical protein